MPISCGFAPSPPTPLPQGERGVAWAVALPRRNRGGRLAGLVPATSTGRLIPRPAKALMPQSAVCSKPHAPPAPPAVSNRPIRLPTPLAGPNRPNCLPAPLAGPNRLNRLPAPLAGPNRLNRLPSPLAGEGSGERGTNPPGMENNHSSRKMTMDQRHFAKALRQNLTDAERLLWKHLRAHRLCGQKFRRQQSIGPYIVDFVHFGTRLVIECDGGQHNDSTHDCRRDAWLNEQGFKVLRFWNHDILNRTESVLSSIFAALPPLSPNPSPARGEGDSDASTHRNNTDRSTPPLSQGEKGDRDASTHRENYPPPPSPLAGEGPGERGNPPQRGDPPQREKANRRTDKLKP